MAKQALEPMQTPAYVESRYYSDLLLNTLHSHYVKDREGVHVSDLAGTCPRKVVFTKLDPHRKLKERQLMYFWDGEAIDEKLRKTFMELIPGRYDTDCHVTYGPINASPDLVDLDRKYIIELKTTDPSADTYLPKIHNIFQLMYYMALMDYEHGTLWYHLITRKKEDGLWREFEVKLNEKERTELRSVILEDAMRFQNALEQKNPYLARHVADDPTLNSWMCINYCPFVEHCVEGWAFREQYFKDHTSKKPLVKNLVKKPWKVFK